MKYHNFQFFICLGGTAKSVTILRSEESAKGKAKTGNRMMRRRAIKKRRKYPNKKGIKKIKRRQTCYHLKMRNMKTVLSQKTVIIGESISSSF